MPENKKRINAFIPFEYYSKIAQSEESFSDFITKTLTFYFSSQEDKKNNETIKTQLIESNLQNEKLNIELNERNRKQSEIKNILEEKESKIKDLQDRNEILVKELENLKNKEPNNKEMLQLQLRIQELQNQLNAKEESQKDRITDLKNQIQILQDQLHTKDEQIKDQNENMHKQAVHIQSLIQENSKLNTKLLPENTEDKKPWWRFW